MTSSSSPIRSCARPRAARVAAVLLVGALGLASAGCDRLGERFGLGAKKEKVSTQAAARVNTQEITVHQINLVLEQQRALPPEQVASASRAVLGRLIDQELAVQEAQNQKLDRDPRVVRQVEAAKREIVARAYAERIGGTAARPSPEDIKKYYEANPALFKERRVYNLEELSIEAKPEQLDAIKTALQNAKDPAAFVDYLKGSGAKFGVRQLLTPAEQLPLDKVGPFSRMKEGQSTFTRTINGAQVLVMLGSRQQPVDEEQARAAIEQFLLNERRHKAIQADLANLRSVAKIEYLGEFANARPEAPAAAAASSSASSAALENALKGMK